MTKIDAANRDLDFEYNLDTPAEFEKIKCVKNMKSLLSIYFEFLIILILKENYKYIVETQDSLINKTIMKQNNIKSPEEIAGLGTRFNVIDDKEYT